MRHVQGEDQGRTKDDPNPIDLSIYVHSSDDDPITEWMKDNGTPVMDDPEGRPDSEIASRMGVNVEEFVSPDRSRSRGRSPGLGIGPDSSDDDGTESPATNNSDDGGDDGGSGGGGDREQPWHDSSSRPFSPFTCEGGYTHATQDEDHGIRRPSRPDPTSTYQRRGKGRKDTQLPIEGIAESFGGFAVRDPYDYNSSDAYSSSGWTGEHQGSQTTDWGISSIFGHPSVPQSTPYSYDGSQSSGWDRTQSSWGNPSRGEYMEYYYPRFSWLLDLSTTEYQEVVERYQTYYSHLSWESYVNWQGVERNREAYQRDINPGRHSTWY
jgi:hypothetical protein